MSVCLPETIKAVLLQPERTVKVVDLPFASQEPVKNLPADEVLIRVRAVALNPTDWKHAFGQLGKPGTVSGSDAAGDVVKVGSQVTHIKIGDRATGFNFGGSWQTNNGAYAEYVRLKAAVCWKLPEGMTYEEAASFPIPHLTAVQALYMRLPIPTPFSSQAPLKEKILIWGGSTAVGHHAVQLATLSGLEVIVTASLGAHKELKALGAARCIDYKALDVVAQIKAAAGPDGVIYALDTHASDGSTEHVVDAMSEKRGGTVITLLPVAEGVIKRRSDVHVEFTLVYTLLGYEFSFAGFPFPESVEDKRRSLLYVTEVMPRILEGWKVGQGAPKIKAQHLRRMEGGLERIYEGLKVMADGNYAREKLVYTVQ
ncbi:chaperonin 10-like protein [Vararia minispora EC-137]|uniref:Chaperonin 10-like protein n=1 Tax=Vararia minispora EC-137 TaxID=1314806 RepID=A0ACB8QHE8_9AGAM|nr:chaperonin 10-like protein [Vararia minispora EC-137]